MHWSGFVGSRSGQAKRRGPCGENARRGRGADIFIGVSGPGIVTRDMVQTIAPDAIVFALANPTPEIMPEEARASGARVVAMGRSDYPNQVNNSLAFPGRRRRRFNFFIALPHVQAARQVTPSIRRVTPHPTPGPRQAVRGRPDGPP